MSTKSLIGLLPPFDPTDNIRIEDFFLHFDHLATLKALNETDKRVQLGCLLKGPAYSVYTQHVLPKIDISYDEAKKILINFLQIKKTDTFTEFVNLRLTESIQKYFHQKTSLASQLDLNTENTLSALTQGVPLEYKKIIGPQLPTTLEKWLEIALFCEGMFKNDSNDIFPIKNNFQRRRQTLYNQNADERPVNVIRGASIPATQSRPSGHFNRQRPLDMTRAPPNPCPKCLRFGRTNYHWGRDCYTNYRPHNNPPTPQINNPSRVSFIENREYSQPLGYENNEFSQPSQPSNYETEHSSHFSGTIPKN